MIEREESVAALGNGVRIVVLRLPELATAAVSVFVRCGSQHERARENGLSHVIEHMAFKGTRTRDCQAINFDAERLGAEVNAHTDKDHTAFHMRGLARNAVDFVRMLGDIVQESTFPDAELARERDVILQEHADDADDGMAVAFRLFDRACFGEHPAARPVIGSPANLRRFTRDDLVDWVRRHYTGANTVVGVAGDVDPGAIVAAAERAFGGMPRGEVNRVETPAYVGGLRVRRLPGTQQSHIVVGFPVPGLAEDHVPFVVAAAMLGEGMSSPLLDQLRERRGLVYHADCWADVRDVYGQFVVEASTPAARRDEYLGEVARLLREHRDSVDPTSLERARNQMSVRTLVDRETPERRLELAALDLYALGRVRSREELQDAIASVGRDRVRAAFATMQEAGAAVAIAGAASRDEAERVNRAFDIAGR